MATDTSTDTGAGRTVTSRPVLFTGLALGTAITVLAVWDGLRLNVPGVPSILRVVLGVLILWALFAAAGAVLSELTVRHHRAVLRHGWRHGKRGGAAAVGWSRRAAQGAAVRSRPWRTRIVTAMRTRWAARTAEPIFSRREADTCPDCGAEPGRAHLPTCPAAQPPASSLPGQAPGSYAGGEGSPADVPTYSWGPAAGPLGWPADDPETAHRWAQHMSTGDGKPQVVTEYPPGGCPGRTIATYVNGKPSTEGNTMTDTTGPAPPRSGRRVLTIGGTVPGEWKNLVSITADFEPEDDADLLAWMASEVNGMSAYAEALTEVYETGVSSVGLDPVSLAALHDTADAAQAMATARQKFAAHYAEVREFAAAGGLLPHDGRWITGDGE